MIFKLDERSRRDVLRVGVAAVAARAAAQPLSPTVGVVIERIQKAVGIPWRTPTVDNLVAGRADMRVRGVASTMMATIEVLEHAIHQGCNLVVTHETPFYLHQDQTADLTDDPTYQFKLRFIREQGLALFHFHDHWHRMQPDGIAVGMRQQLGWTNYADAGDPRRFTLPAVTLRELAEQMKTRLGASTMRVIGDPKLEVRKIFASWGFASRMPGIPQFRAADIDVMLVGETREWELAPYVQDTISRGEKKGLIVIGHVASEQAGMKYCAEWLRPLVPEVPVRYIVTPEPFWSV